MGWKPRLLGIIGTAVAASIGLAPVCNAQAQQPSSLPGWLVFSPAALDSRANTFVPPNNDPQPAGSADASANDRTNKSGEKTLNLAPLGAGVAAAAGAPSGRSAVKPFAPSPAAGNFDGRMRLGEPSFRFATETAVKTVPLRDENDTGFNDTNPRSGRRIPFIGLSIVSPIQ